MVFSVGVVLFSVLSPSLVAFADGPTITQDDRFGIDFVSAPGVSFSDQTPRYFEAAQAGAGWNRWPLYWSNLESSCDRNYDWSMSDSTVAADVANNLQIDAILMGTPQCYATTTSIASILPLDTTLHRGMSVLSTDSRSPPAGLNNTVFSDGTDVWAPGKAINPANPWAEFVNATVTRYHGQIHSWEIWNEPDNSGFWTGSIADYYRLLQVGYLSAHAADGSARILVGGMMYWQWANAHGDQSWLNGFLADALADPTAPANGYYFDVIPWHFYSRSLDVYNHILSAENILASKHVTGKEMWLNETNVPGCGDYAVPNGFPSPVSCGSGANFPPGFGTITEQASFIIQATAYAFDVGASKVFEFQMEDDGNGEAFGMFRNDQSKRPIYTAYQLIAKYIEGFDQVQRATVNNAEFVQFHVPAAMPRRVTIMWNDTGQPVIATIAAATGLASCVQLVAQNGTTIAVPASSSYKLSLPAATNNRNYDVPWNPNDYAIGGPTEFLVENLAISTQPPKTRVIPVLPVSPPTGFTITWETVSNPNAGGINYTIQSRDTTVGGNWTNLLTNTTVTSLAFSPIAGHSYQFRSLGKDCLGQLESKGPDQADMQTATTGTNHFDNLPLVFAGVSSGW